MQTHARVAVAPRRQSPGLKLQPPEPPIALLDSLGDCGREDHIVILGHDGPDLMCGLLRAGAQQVSHLRSLERSEADSASLVIVPHLASADWLAAALPAVRRVLVANGRLVIAMDVLPSTLNQVRHLLTLHGFVEIRLGRAVGQQVLCAEIPAFGLRRCA
ncbi:MAG: hypothetical protein WDN25_28960 [Acetobacteraceae bacterium]